VLKCKIVSVYAVIAGVFLFTAANAFADPCSDLLKLNFSHAAISAAELIAGGRFTPPGMKSMNELPPFCRVAASLRPSDDSDIRVEVWMPQTGWNGRLEGTGNGGFAGHLVYGALASGIRLGYAVANTDMGMSVPDGSDASIFVNRPERWIDWGSRSTHEMTLFAKALVKAYYGRLADRSYFVGCSTGGEQALAEAQKFPADYDGIVAGAAANNRTGVHLSILWNFAAMQRTADSYISPAQLSTLNKAVLKACGGTRALDAGFLDNPEHCTFNPEALRCSGSNSENCLTEAQLATVRSLYSGPVNPRTREALYPGLAAGSEYAWNKIDPQPLTAQEAPYAPIFKWVFGPQWNWRSFDFDRQVKTYQNMLGDDVNATSPNLDEFRRLGHKLLVYHGWADWLVPPGEAVAYYNSVIEQYRHEDTHRNESHEDVGSFYRLFMVPGMEHCSGGPGPDSFDSLSAVVAWVEHDAAPDGIVATKYGPDGNVRFQRPLCPYPEVAEHRDGGDEKAVSGYSCMSPQPTMGK
jgi:feruloyl esterase